MAIGYLVYDITGSPFLIGVVEAGFAIPTPCFARFGGAVADCLDCKRVIQTGQGTAVLVGVLLAVSILTGAITWVRLMVAALIDGSRSAFLMPAWQLIIPRLVEREQFTIAMALNSAASSSMTMEPSNEGRFSATAK